MTVSGGNVRYYSAAGVLILTNVAVFLCFYLMSREVNNALPPDVTPFPALVDRSRGFELIRLHRRLFPRSWLQEVAVLLVVVGLGSAAALAFF